jgi:Raf kinase inhibitor-like YbhB/YbcL family protein
VRRSAKDRLRPAAIRLAAMATCGLVLTGCGLLGKPQPLRADAPLDMSVTSPEFAGGVMPARFTCHGTGESPPIFWSGAPAGTKSLALVVDDSGAPISPRVYWIVFDIGVGTTDLQIGPPASARKTAQSTLPPGARVAVNSAGTAGYDPPCPTSSDNKYRFTVYALNTYFGSSLPDDARLLDAWTMIASHVIGRGTFTAQAIPG